ncbi:tetratricopeptide repeat protein [Thermoflexus sp.]|uniref:tetratricopeptide repeat protein n=1 Tax=Thermoflexus sp. TaxID=1969742 RepID=UPI0035E4538D
MSMEIEQIRASLLKPGEDAERARLLTTLGRAPFTSGQQKEAMETTQEAVNIYRELAQTSPQVFLPDLATSLNRLGNRLSDLGRREEALAALEEAVRTLAPSFTRSPTR